MLNFVRIALKNRHNPGFPFISSNASILTLHDNGEPKIRVGLNYFWHKNWHFVFTAPDPQGDETLEQLGRIALRFTQLPPSEIGRRVRIWVTASPWRGPSRPLELRFRDLQSAEPLGPVLIDGGPPRRVIDAITKQKLHSV